MPLRGHECCRNSTSCAAKYVGGCAMAIPRCTLSQISHDVLISTISSDICTRSGRKRRVGKATSLTLLVLELSEMIKYSLDASQQSLSLPWGSALSYACMKVMRLPGLRVQERITTCYCSGDLNGGLGPTYFWGGEMYLKVYLLTISFLFP